MRLVGSVKLLIKSCLKYISQDLLNSLRLPVNENVMKKKELKLLKNSWPLPDSSKNWVGGGQDYFLLQNEYFYQQDFVRSSTELQKISC